MTTRSGRRDLTLLIVDDSAMMRAMVRRVATLSGVAVEAILEAGNGREALESSERTTSTPCSPTSTCR